MPQIMKTNLPQPMLLQQYRKMLREVAGFDQFPHLIHINVLEILIIVASAAELPILCLPFFQPEQQFFKGFHQR